MSNPDPLQRLLDQDSALDALALVRARLHGDWPAMKTINAHGSANTMIALLELCCYLIENCSHDRDALLDSLAASVRGHFDSDGSTR